MSAVQRVAHAAETIRARWERGVAADPQTEAAQALEDTGQLLGPEVAAELTAFRKEHELAAAVRELGALPMPVGPESLSPGREAEIREWVEAMGRQKDIRYYGSWQQHGELLGEIDRLRAVRAEIGNEIARFGIYGAALPAAKALVKRADELVTENAALRARVAELEARAGDPAMVCRECNAPVMWVDSTSGGWWNHTGLAEDGHGIVPKPLLRPSPVVSASRLTAFFAPTQALREDPHDSPLHHSYEVGRDLPETGGGS